ncbi:hypothetical protein Ctob_005207 [Chrysochromulina tobinii]|uniref:Uncharacterized protein n=1 Tax=Chrysochromulina tobinii TaxID=1460289 RepID=A0A0M0JA80_9EUKA|nr:hypothetical protein Ctob_005207 [Chrysochromulina tobinii]|eukprot:KOO23405.1 hypothetical protein Ctob_005207 [Chrysochromulina sp. CCMP291]
MSVEEDVPRIAEDVQEYGGDSTGSEHVELSGAAVWLRGGGVWPDDVLYAVLTQLAGLTRELVKGWDKLEALLAPDATQRDPTQARKLSSILAARDWHLLHRPRWNPIGIPHASAHDTSADERLLAVVCHPRIESALRRHVQRATASVLAQGGFDIESGQLMQQLLDLQHVLSTLDVRDDHLCEERGERPMQETLREALLTPIKQLWQAHSRSWFCGTKISEEDLNLYSSSPRRRQRIA